MMWSQGLNEVHGLSEGLRYQYWYRPISNCMESTISDVFYRQYWKISAISTEIIFYIAYRVP